MNIHVFRFILVYLIIGTTIMYLGYNKFVKVCKEVIESDARFRNSESLQWIVYVVSMIILILGWPKFLTLSVIETIKKRGKDDDEQNGV